GQLAGGVAHDFNNLLTVIEGHTSLLAGERLEPDAADSVQQIAHAAERAANLTRQLLTFSRKQMMQPRRLDLSQVVHDTGRLLQRLLGEQISLEFESVAGLPFVHADASMVEQILMNLAINSRDAMPRGGRLVIRTSVQRVDEVFAQQEPEATPGQYVCLHVTDTGAGIPEQHLPRIFEPFFTTKEVGKGTGLGLATVYGIVKLHGGWIRVESVPGKGTTFRVYFPVADHAWRAAEPTTPRQTAGRGTETILLVEDEPTVRQLARRILERHGYRVLEACDGPAALEVWRAHGREIDLLLTDMVMPHGITGGELADQLMAAKPGLKILFTSGYSTELFDTSNREGVNFLQKPYESQKLTQAVRQCLDG
ncbi:MAG: ATP-binding protein, partial [Verrucomicrobiota bacterium]